MNANNDPIQKEIAKQFTGESCYLDGAPAKVTGRLNAFATIAPLNPALPSVEYSWHTVNRIMRKDRYFTAK